MITIVGTQYAFGGLIVVDLSSPIEASVSCAAGDYPKTPEPEPPNVEKGQSLAGEPTTSFSTTFASSAWLASELHILNDDDVVARWYRDRGNVHSKIIPFDLLRPPQA